MKEDVMKSELEDFISLSSSKPEESTECDVLLLSASDEEPDTPKPSKKPIFSLLKSSKRRAVPALFPEPTLTSQPPTKHIKPFYPQCKRVTTTRQPVHTGAPTHSSNTLTTPSTAASGTATSSVSALTLSELMSAPDLTSPTKRAEDPLETVERVNKLLKQAEVEKGTLQGYIDTLQKRLAIAEAAVRVNNSGKSSETQTEDIG